MTDYTMPFPAAKVEVTISDEFGNTVRYSFDDFDWVEVEDIREPQFFHPDGLPATPNMLARLSFHLERPRKYTIYAPHLAASLDQGDIVDEG